MKIHKENNATTGRFISFEGTEGVGKTTAIKELGDRLELAGIKHIKTREPGGTPFYEKLRDILINPDTDINDDTELLLLFAGRCDHVQRVIIPALESGTWVICDRFVDSSIAYQGYGRAFGNEAILNKINMLIEQFISHKPELTLWLDMDVEEGMKRANKRSSLDRFEQQKIDFFLRIHGGFKMLADQNQQRIKRVDANGSMDEVNSRIWTTVQECFHIENKNPK